MSKSPSYSITLGKTLNDAAGYDVCSEIKEREEKIGGSKNKFVGSMFRELNELRQEVNVLRQKTSAGFDMSSLKLSAAVMDGYDDNSEADLVKMFFQQSDKELLDTGKVKRALVSQAKRDYTASKPSEGRQRASFYDVQIRIGAVVSEMMRLNESVEWYLRESINTKSISINARVNIPAAKEYLSGENGEAVENHNAKFCIDDNGKASPYFNRKAIKTAKSEPYNLKAVKRIEYDKEEDSIKAVERAL